MAFPKCVACTFTLRGSRKRAFGIAVEPRERRLAPLRVQVALQLPPRRVRVQPRPLPLLVLEVLLHLLQALRVLHRAQLGGERAHLLLRRQLPPPLVEWVRKPFLVVQKYKSTQSRSKEKTFVVRARPARFARASSHRS